ncbi:hypothetical protein [Symbioplanes lichenis]|uniref:hypothetical protein n=1 Tax=Symbioplanes lichenis TaxID=1629072 RepID=UPI0027389C45|nr:hypothetical protein [Actinoplanes lichenis]
MIRRPGRKPTLALWMLVALADVAVLVAARPVPALLALVAAALLAATVAVLAARTPAPDVALAGSPSTPDLPTTP